MSHAFLVVTNCLPHLTIANFKSCLVAFYCKCKCHLLGEDEKKGNGKSRGKKLGEDNNGPM
jgi:hypothetical protein